MNMLKCECGNTVFENVATHQYDENEFMVRGPCTQIKPEILCIPVLRCIACTRIHVPSTSLVGRNQLDPAVKAYSQLLDAVEYWNKKVNTFEDNLVSKIIEDFRIKLDDVLIDIQSIKESYFKQDNLEVEKPVKEVQVEQTGKRGRKKS